METTLDSHIDPDTLLDPPTAIPATVDEDRLPTLTEEEAEEALVADARAHLTPSQMVERKLVSLLKANPLPVSQVMSGSRTFRR
jgi:hypothetical protein